MQRAVRRHAQRHAFGSLLFYKLAREYSRWYRNCDDDHETNGEAYLLQRLPPLGIIFDVGANVGTWSRLAGRYHPDAEIHAFELVPETRERLKRTTSAIVHDFGLSDVDDTVAVTFYPGETTNSALAGMTATKERIHSTLSVPVRRLDSIWTGPVDLLKIDVEGAEDRVLDGARDALNEGRISTIQFEYGFANAETRFLLADFYARLSAYEIGKLFPIGVDFRPYDRTQEDFLGPNYVAVLKSRPDIIEAVRLRS